MGLFVNESTLLPVLLPFAPAATVIDRFPEALATVLRRHGIGEAFIEVECAAMADHRLAKTKNRSVVGTMTELAFLGGAYSESADLVDLLELSLWLARTPCGPLHRRQGSPDGELPAHLAGRVGGQLTAQRLSQDGGRRNVRAGRPYGLESRQSPRRGHG